MVAGCFGFRVFFRGTSTAFSVRPGSFMGVNSLAFEFGGALARLLQIDTRYFVKCPTVADLLEGAIQVCARNFVKGPAVGELPGGDDHALTRDLQLVLQTGSGPFWALSSSLASYTTANNMSVKIMHLGVRIGVLLACGAWAPFAIVKELVQIPEPLLCYHEIFHTFLFQDIFFIIPHSHTHFLCSLFPSLSLFFSFQRGVPVAVSAFMLAWIAASTPLALYRVSAFRGLVFVRGWCPSFVVPHNQTWSTNRERSKAVSVMATDGATVGCFLNSCCACCACLACLACCACCHAMQARLIKLSLLCDTVEFPSLDVLVSHF